ncbi:hypothetical protein [Haloarcula laminariae]|uniref:hypothetical protein n=1 Tax=Haloarcula laminariae TaxID=2961577 RepID=UPI0021C73FD7|nr:hypothetical protein [Halomicroarcula laminariae]
MIVDTHAGANTYEKHAQTHPEPVGVEHGTIGSRESTEDVVTTGLDGAAHERPEDGGD